MRTQCEAPYVLQRIARRAWLAFAVVLIGACGGGGSSDGGSGGGGGGGGSDGSPPPAAEPATGVVELANNAVVFDAARSVFYASVPGRVPNKGNSIATINATSGAVSHSAPVGSEPGVMALAADGASLYVALDGSSEVVRLALPAMTEMGRVRLPTDAFFGATVAESIATSPADASVFAVSLAHPGVSPKHAGVMLVRNLTAQPRRTQVHTGSNLIAFAPDGSHLHGFNNETTEFGLRRIAVLADGLQEGPVVGTNNVFYLTNLQRAGSRLLLGNRMFDSATLNPLGQFSGASGCVFISAERVACFRGDPSSGGTLSLMTGRAANFVVSSPFEVASSSSSDWKLLVAGLAGQVAVRDGIAHPALREAARIQLVAHPGLR